METISRTSTEARKHARYPVGKTFLNTDAIEEATVQMASIPWVRAYGWGGEGRGVYAILEPALWLEYKDGGHGLSGLTLAITVDSIEDLGRHAFVEGGGVRRSLDRWALRGTIYRLRDDDLALGVRPMPGGAVPFEQVLSLPNLVRVSGLHPRTDA